MPPPSMPTRCTLTPTHVKPSRIRCRCVIIQSAGMSRPPVTLSHSMITLPLARAGSSGRYTTSLVVYSALADASTCHRPSGSKGAAAVYEVARPVTTCSCTAYPTDARSNPTEKSDGVPSSAGPIVACCSRTFRDATERCASGAAPANVRRRAAGLVGVVERGGAPRKGPRCRWRNWTGSRSPTSSWAMVSRGC